MLASPFRSCFIYIASSYHGDNGADSIYCHHQYRQHLMHMSSAAFLPTPIATVHYAIHNVASIRLILPCCHQYYHQLSMTCIRDQSTVTYALLKACVHAALLALLVTVHVWYSEPTQPTCTASLPRLLKLPSGLIGGAGGLVILVGISNCSIAAMGN